MKNSINKVIDFLSNFLAPRKGLLPLLGLGLITINLIIQFLPGITWPKTTNIFLHIGLIMSILGLLIAWAL